MSIAYLCALFRQIDRKLCIYVLCVLLPFILSPLAANPEKESRCAYVVILVALYWLLEPVPIAVTAFAPIVLFPLLGVVNSNEICKNYMKQSYMMFMGGLILAVAIEECLLHERIALKVLLLVGSEIKWLMLGLMCTTMFLSMWMSNTTTVTMMVPIVEMIVEKISQKSDDIEMKSNGHSGPESKEEKSPQSDENVIIISPHKNECRHSTVKLALLLCMCYSANIGGTGTLTGTGPNIILKVLMEEFYPGSKDITFATWMMYNVPGMLLCVVIGWLFLWLVYIKCSADYNNQQSNKNIKRIIREKYQALGSMSFHEGQVLILFVSLVLLWVFRDPKFITGWSDAINSGTEIGDSVPAIGIAFLLFLLPADPRDPGGRPILEWKTAQAKLPWGVFILIGGGFSLADAAQKSGLSLMLGDKLSALEVLSPFALVTVMCLITTMLTEIMSNATTAAILLPVFNQMALSVKVNPLFLMLPVTVVCSYAFMLPVACPSNAIVYNSGRMKTIEMVKPGIFMNLVCCGVQLVMINTVGVAMFDLYKVPAWVHADNSTEVINGTDFNVTFTGNMSWGRKPLFNGGIYG